MNKIDFDVDIDMANRDKFLELVNHIPASIEKDGKLTKHNSGVYFQDIPYYPLDDLAAIEYKQAAEEGWFKVDFLNNSIYADVKDNQHLDILAAQEPMWDLFEHAEIVEKLVHINNYASLLAEYKPTSLPQLAMILALIRPSKKHLMGKPWDEIEKEIWVKPTDDSYYFKKSHAHAYALSIVVQLNIMVEKLQ